MTLSIFSKLKENLVLLSVNIKVNIWTFIEYCHVVVKYYSDPTFFKMDTTLLLSYLFASPFRISKRFLLLKGEKEVYTYGQTP